MIGRQAGRQAGGQAGGRAGISARKCTIIREIIVDDESAASTIARQSQSRQWKGNSRYSHTTAQDRRWSERNESAGVGAAKNQGGGCVGGGRVPLSMLGICKHTAATIISRDRACATKRNSKSHYQMFVIL